MNESELNYRFHSTTAPTIVLVYLALILYRTQWFLCTHIVDVVVVVANTCVFIYAFRQFKMHHVYIMFVSIGVLHYNFKPLKQAMGKCVNKNWFLCIVCKPDRFECIFLEIFNREYALKWLKILNHIPCFSCFSSWCKWIEVRAKINIFQKRTHKRVQRWFKRVKMCCICHFIAYFK